LYLVPNIYKYLKIQKLFLTDNIWINICYKFFLNFLRNCVKFKKNLILIQILGSIKKNFIYNYFLLNLIEKKNSG
jgi:hypothetical protein